MTLERYIVKDILRFPTRGMTGRAKIKTNVQEITEENVREVLQKALAVHSVNAAQITYLYAYYKGSQDVRYKKKYVRENINNKVTVNRANEIVTFKTAYLLNEPIQYISHGDSGGKTNEIIRLNEYMRAENKKSKDKEVVDWMHICGIGERFTITDEMAGKRTGAPYYIHTLDPREAFVIYSAKIGNRPMAGVILQYDEEDRLYADIYTSNQCFTVTQDTVTVAPHSLGEIPLVEYENNMARMGSFELVIPILNAINTLESDSIDSVDDYINGFDVFQNCEITDGEYGELSIGGKAVKVKTLVQGMEAKVYRVVSELSQQGVQTRIDDLTEAYLTICGMPNRNGGSSTSDTGQAVIFRDGWSEAESRAKDSETQFEKSEKQFLQIVLNICSGKPKENPLKLELKDIGINFARKSLNNLQSRFQCLTEGLANDKIHPQMAYNAFGDVFGDKTAAYKLGMKWYAEQKAEAQEELDSAADAERERIKRNGENNAETVPAGGSGDQGTEPPDSEKS